MHCFRFTIAKNASSRYYARLSLCTWVSFWSSTLDAPTESSIDVEDLV